MARFGYKIPQIWMSDPTRKDLLNLLSQIRDKCDLLEVKINDIKPKKEWLSTKEFAARSKLDQRTVSNYASAGRFHRQKKDGRGYWMIHRTELSKYK